MNKEDFEFYMAWARNQLSKAEKSLVCAKFTPTKQGIRQIRMLHRDAAANLKGARKALHER